MSYDVEEPSAEQKDLLWEKQQVILALTAENEKLRLDNERLRLAYIAHADLPESPPEVIAHQAYREAQRAELEKRVKQALITAPNLDVATTTEKYGRVYVRAWHNGVIRIDTEEGKILNVYHDDYVIRERAMVEAVLGSDLLNTVEQLLGTVQRPEEESEDDSEGAEVSEEPGTDGRLTKRAVQFLRTLARDFVQSMDANPFAPNYLEIPMANDDGDLIVVITLQRPNGKTPTRLKMEAEVDNIRLKALLGDIARMAARASEEPSKE